ncbi:MAG: ISNCY family transposase [Planctomycetaceae bacterium]|nr:ISNCY family transposase [Planctomycetaceae bacterium]
MNRTTWLQDRRMLKFRDVLSRWERKELSAMEAGEILGMSERQFRRYRVRYEEEGLAGLADRRLGKASAKRVPVDQVAWLLSEYRSHHLGWNVRHFHEHLRQHHGFRWGYTWTKTQLHTAGLVERAARRGAHRRKRPRKPCEGMMLHQDGSRFAWLEVHPQLDLIVTMDDATSTIYSAFLVEEEGTGSTFRALLEVFTAQGLPSSLYTDRGAHYFFTPKAGEAVDRGRLTQVGRALDRLGIEHIPAYSPEARGRSERMFGTLQDRLPKELKLAGIGEIDAANRFIRDVYLPAHNARFARPAQLAESAFVPIGDRASLMEILCIEQERIVARDNTICHAGHRLQLPASPLRPHYVKARVKLREYPDGSLAVFHGPRRIARYSVDGAEIIEVPNCPSVTPCSLPSRRGLAATELVGSAERRPALTDAAPGVEPSWQVGTKKRSSGRTKKLGRGRPESAAAAA